MRPACLFMSIASILGIASVVSSEEPAKPQDASPAAGTLVLSRHSISDPIANTDALSLLLPEGWKVAGRIDWVAPTSGLVLQSLAAFDPATGTGLRIYPRRSFTFIDGLPEGFYQGGENHKIPASPLDFIKFIVLPRYRPDMNQVREVKIVSSKSVPEYAAAQTAHLPNAKVVTSQIRLAYVIADQKVEEEFFCTLVVMPQLGAAPMRGWWGEAVSFAAPAGKLDESLGLLNSIRNSITLELKWFNIVQQVYQTALAEQQREKQRWIEINGKATDEMIARYRESSAKASAEVSQQIRQRFENQQRVKGEMAQQELDYIRGEQRFSNPSSGSTVIVPAGYNYAYQGTNGNVILTNDAAFRPPVEPNLGWQILDKSR